MGRGDKRTAKGKRFKGSFGNARTQRTGAMMAASAEKTAVQKKADKKG